jgi:hypothetical protein
MTLNKNTAIYAFAAFAGWFAWRSMGKPGAAKVSSIFDMLAGNRKESGAAISQNTAKIQEILDGSGSSYSNGWRYFTDGTAIDPQGNYYQNGALIWSPA